MSYVDGYVIPVPKKNLKKYVQMAREGENLWRKHGAIDYKECIGEDLNPQWGASFKKITRAKPNETVIFSYVVYRSRAHRDQVNAKVMKEIEGKGGINDMPFDMKRMVYGGFETAVGK